MEGDNKNKGANLLNSQGWQTMALIN